MPDPSVNLKRIAALAGVSAMTVSRALRNEPNVLATTRERVLKFSRQLNYRPNPLVSALMAARRSSKPLNCAVTIAFVTDFRSRSSWKRQPLFQEFFTGAAAAADKHGYKVEEFWLGETGMTPARLGQILFHRNISGVLIAPLPAAQGDLPMPWEHFSAVALGYTLANPSLHRAVNHQFRSMRLAVGELKRLGYTRLGLAFPASLDARAIQHWLGAFLVEQHGSPIESQVPPLVLPDDQWTETNFLAWMRRHRPDAIIGHSEDLFKWVAARGIEVPKDLGFLHLNCPNQTGPISGIYQNGPAIGAVAVEFLIGMLQRNERGIPPSAHSILVDGIWVPGTTLRSQP